MPPKEPSSITAVRCPREAGARRRRSTSRRRRNHGADRCPRQTRRPVRPTGQAMPSATRFGSDRGAGRLPVRAASIAAGERSRGAAGMRRRVLAVGPRSRSWQATGTWPFSNWGAKPSVQLLRHRDETVDPLTKQRHHALLAARLGINFPSADDERMVPAQADQLYETASRWLLEQTRDAGRFGLLLKENIDYGFRRNLYGVKYLGLAVAVICLLVIVSDVGLFLAVSPDDLVQRLMSATLAQIVALGLCASMLMAWWLGVSERRVRSAAFAYAERLVAACESLSPRIG